MLTYACIEKPMAMNLEDAKVIKKAVDESGIKAVVNWTVVWRDYIHKMNNALD